MSDRTYYSHEAETRANREKMTAILLFMGLGLGIGTVLALLFAPKTGDETRHNLGSAFEDRFSAVEKELSSLGKKVEDRIRDMR